MKVKEEQSKCNLIDKLFFFIFPEFSNALRLIEVRVPNYTVKDNVVRLECIYDMEDEKLYSVKWYKDGHEFYRYLPRDHPPATLFPLPGINVDVRNETFYWSIN